MKNKLRLDPMNNDNFFLAVVLSVCVLVGFHYIYEKPRIERHQHSLLAQKIAETAPQAAPTVPTELKAREAVLKETPRVQVETSAVKGSINLMGARIDDLSLVRYKEIIAPDAKPITLLSPAGSAAPHKAYYAEFGWLGSGVDVPTAETVWTADRKRLEENGTIHLSWTNEKGAVFEREIAIDDHYMFTITDRVKNAANETITLYPYGLIARHGRPHTEDSMVLHEGPMGVIDGTLKEVKYKELIESKKMTYPSQGGWIGITDKFWLMSMVPNQEERLDATLTYTPSRSGEDSDALFQTDYRGTAVSLAPNATAVYVHRLFAGAKEVRVLDQYETQYNIPLFDRAIDFGWYYYLTKPFLYLLDYLSGELGNLGLAIICFTLLLKAATFPLAMKSFRSMAKMRVLAPEIKAVQERFKDDRARAATETMELYKREKVSPMSGCWPSLIQIPIFFALYKVLYVGIEVRHAPLFGWIHDLSAMDPTSVLTGFGLIDLPLIPHIGVWPILMGLSIHLQQRMSPPATDPVQAKVFKFLPVLMTFMLAKVAAGLIFYWTFSNILGSAQQWYVYRKYPRQPT